MGKPNRGGSHGRAVGAASVTQRYPIRHVPSCPSADSRAFDALTDGDLLERFVRRHEEAAFAALVQRHGPMVLSVCERVLRHSQDADDAFQGAFIVLAQKAHRLRRPGLLANPRAALDLGGLPVPKGFALGLGPRLATVKGLALGLGLSLLAVGSR